MHLEISFCFNTYQTSNYNQLLPIQYEVKLIAVEGVGEVGVRLLPVQWTYAESPVDLLPFCFLLYPLPPAPHPEEGTNLFLVNVVLKSV